MLYMDNISYKYQGKLEEAVVLVGTFQIKEGLAYYQQIIEDKQTVKADLIEALLQATTVLTDYGYFEQAQVYVERLSKLELSHPAHVRYLIAKGDVLNKLGDFVHSVEIATEALAYCEQHKESCESLLVRCLLIRGILANWSEKATWITKAYEALDLYECSIEDRVFCFGLMGIGERDLKGATAFFEKAEEIAKTQLKYPKLWLSRILRYRFSLIFKGGSFDDRLADCKAYEQLHESVNRNLPTTEIVYVYNNISYIYMAKSDYFESIFYAQKALLLGEKFNLKTQVPSCQQLSYVYQNIGSIELALKYGLKGVELFKKANPAWATSTHVQELADVYFYIGNIYKDTGNRAMSEDYYLKCKEVFDRTINDEKNFVYQPLWIVLAELNPNTKGLEYAQKGLDTEGPAKHHLYITMGDAYIALDEINKGLEYYHLSLKENLLTNHIFNVNNKDFQFQFNNYEYAINVISKIGKTHYSLYVSMKGEQVLDKAIAYFDYAFELIALFQKGIEDKSQISFNDKLVDIYGYYIKALYAQNSVDFNKILTIFEACKSNVLHQSLIERKAKKELINTDFVQKDMALKAELNELERALAQIEEAKRGETYNQFFEKRKEYQEFVTSLETEYPDYYQAKYNINTTSLTDIQGALGEEEKILHYLVGENEIFILYIDIDDVELVITPKSTTFKKDIEELLQAIQTYNQAVYQEKARLLYKELVEPVSDLLFGILVSEDIQNLVIIPYGILSKLPFETLINAKNEGNQKQHLLDFFDISYHYSATLWNKERKRGKGEKAPTQIDFLGMAPIYEKAKKENSEQILKAQSTNRNYWEHLPYSKIEVEEISQKFETASKIAQVFLKEEASLENLKQNIPQAKYVHLAAHFHQHEVPQLSGLVLSDNIYLLIDDVYAFDIQAELVVLSACESGIGTVSNSEGMMAISRGLLYAGVQNIVTTLFAINDKLTSRLMILFYEELLKGNSVKKALSHAKRILSKQEDVSVVVWSAFILIGN